MNFIKLTLSHDNYSSCEKTIYVAASSIVNIRPLIIFHGKEVGASVSTLTSGSYPLSVAENASEILRMLR